MSVCSDGDSEGSSQAKVSQFDVTLTTDQKVLWLEVTMQHSVGVAVRNAIHHLIQVALWQH